MPTVLADNEECDITVEFKDAKGHAARVDGVPAWSSSDEAVLTVAAAGDGLSCTVTAQDVGTALVTLTADADLGAGVTPIIGTADFVVDPGSAVIADLLPGAPRAQGSAPSGGGAAPVTTVDPSTGARAAAARGKRKTP